MKRWKIAASAAAAVVGVTGAAACDSTSPADHESLATSTKDPFPLTPEQAEEERAIKAATPVIREYFRVYLAVLKYPGAGPKPFESVATGRELRDLRAEWRMARRNGWRATGEARIADLTITHADVKTRPAVVEADVCYDVTGVGGVDRAGNSIVSAKREDQSLSRMRLTNPTWPGGQWMVVWTESKNQPC